MGLRLTYSTTGGLLVAALSSHLESNIVGGVALDLDGTGGLVVEVLVQQLQRDNSISNRCVSCFPADLRDSLMREISDWRWSRNSWGRACRLKCSLGRIAYRELTSLADLEISEKAGTDILGEGMKG